MSYLGFAKHISEGFLSHIDYPIVLEIGLDKGQTTLPILHNLLMSQENGFLYIGVDIKLNTDFIEQTYNFSNLETFVNPTSVQIEAGKNRFCIINKNSIDFLSAMKESGAKKIFDLVLIDGDHNYFTVEKELKLLKPLVKPTTLMVCDDYHGRYSKKDMFYSELDGYRDISFATKKVNSEKVGVKAAVDDFVRNSELNYRVDAIIGEPCLLYRDDILGLNFSWEKNWYDSTFNFYLRGNN